MPWLQGTHVTLNREGVAITNKERGGDITVVAPCNTSGAYHLQGN